MNLQQTYEQVLQKSLNMALATSVEGQPNLRVVTFAYDPAQPGKLFFSTFPGCQKIAELTANPQVACLPLALTPEDEDKQVRIFGRVQKSALPMDKLIDLIGAKTGGDTATWDEGADVLEIYEVAYSEAWVTQGMAEAQRLPVA